MRTIVALEKRFDCTPDGSVWSQGWLDYLFWQRYLDVFDHVRVVARIRNVHRVPGSVQRADGPNVSFAPVPYYIGPWQFVRRYRSSRRALRVALTGNDAVILRLPGWTGGMLEGALRAAGRPYAVEVVGDPHDVFAPGAVRSVLRPFLRWWVPRALRRQCAGACAAAYVTAATLQQRYPPAPEAYAASYSSADLGPEAFVAAPRTVRRAKSPWQVILVGSLAHLYKGPEVLIEAVAHCVSSGLDLRLTIVGDGKHRPELEALAHSRGLAGHARFVGTLVGGRDVRAELDRADLFVLPSRQEGLPRVVLEAMARGLPCVGSRAGGIPELLGSEELVAPGDAAALAGKIREVLTDDARMARLSARNLEKAREFEAAILRSRRQAFYEAVRGATLKWQRSQAGGIG